jgi:hypothetical protein
VPTAAGCEGGARLKTLVAGARFNNLRRVPCMRCDAKGNNVKDDVDVARNRREAHIV